MKGNMQHCWPRHPLLSDMWFFVSMVQLASGMSFSKDWEVAFISFPERFNFTKFSTNRMFFSLGGSLQSMHESVSAVEKVQGKALGELSFLQLIKFSFRAPELSAGGGKNCSPCFHHFWFGFSQLCLFPSEANLSLEEVGGNNSSCSSAFLWLKNWSLECTIPIVRIPENVLSSLNGIPQLIEITCCSTGNTLSDTRLFLPSLIFLGTINC